MALDREKTFRSAERLLKQGKIPAALAELQLLAEDAPRDAMGLNRAGDLLAQAGRGTEAVQYYDRAVELFSRSGFYPKASAVLKKVLKLAPGRTDTLVRLGDFYLKQKHSGEARAVLLQAAEQFLRARQFTDARKVYERLVAAEPDDPRHRARLAETRAAEGDTARAGEDLVALGATLASQGKPEDAERAYRRAAELLPRGAEPLLGLASVLDALGRGGEAIPLLERGLAEGRTAPDLAGALVLRYVRAGRDRDLASLLAGARGADLPTASLEALVRDRLAAGDDGRAWEILDPVLARWRAGERLEEARALLDRLGDLTAQGYVPALQRLVDGPEDGVPAAVRERTRRRLARALRGEGREAEASRIEATMGPAVVPAAPAPAPASPLAAPSPAPAPSAPAAVAAADPPALPSGPADEEYVAGQMTEAEVLQNYGLLAEAQERLRAVAERFPGHLPAREKLVAAIRAQGNRKGLGDALAGLALARRLAGNVPGAMEAAREAAVAGIPDPVRASLVDAGLLERPAAAAPAPPPKAPRAKAKAKAAAPPPPPPPPPAPAPAPVPAPAPPPVPEAAARRAPEAEDEMTISFDEDALAAEDAAADAPPAPVRGAGLTPRAEDLEEIAFYLQQGMVAEAAAAVRGLRARGFAGPALDLLAAQAREGAPAPPAAEIEIEAGGGGGDEPDVRLDEESLGALAQALEETAAPAPIAAAPAPEAEEQSLEDVFAAFKQHVEAEVGQDDYRTHYDLGIAYKEMGLLEDAVAEFERASADPGLRRDACGMIALVHRERGDAPAAAAWYRRALEGSPVPPAEQCGLRYDLGEALLESGDAAGALEAFRGVVAVDAAYRDAEARVRQLESSLGR